MGRHRGKVNSKIYKRQLRRIELCLTKPLRERITLREWRVVELICDGYDPQYIASELGISVKTFSTHRANALAKLEVGNNVLLTRLAIKEGWITL